LRPKKCLLAMNSRLREVVASKLILEWSPEQISGWLKTEYPNDERMRVSHETIYRSLFIQARGVLKKELMGHLRSKRRMRRPQHSRIFKDSRGRIADAISIRERPAEVEDRAVPGHWEGEEHWATTIWASAEKEAGDSGPSRRPASACKRRSRVRGLSISRQFRRRRVRSGGGGRRLAESPQSALFLRVAWVDWRARLFPATGACANARSIRRKTSRCYADLFR